MFTNISIINDDKGTVMHREYQIDIFNLITKIRHAYEKSASVDAAFVNLQKYENIYEENHWAFNKEYDEINIISSILPLGSEYESHPNDGSAVYCNPVYKFKYLRHKESMGPGEFEIPSDIYYVNIYKVLNSDHKYFYVIAYTVEGAVIYEDEDPQDKWKKVCGHIANSKFSIVYLQYESPVTANIDKFIDIYSAYMRKLNLL